MANQSPPPPPIMDSTQLPNNTPATPFNNVNPNLWSVTHPLTSPAAGQVQLISPFSAPHPILSSGTPTSPPAEERKKPRRCRKKTSKKGPASLKSKSSASAPATTTESLIAEDKSSQKQESWEKDLNSDGKTMIDHLETKFRDAQKWAKQTGEGGGLAIKQDAEFEIERLQSTTEWTKEQEQEIRSMAAQTTKDAPITRPSSQSWPIAPGTSRSQPQDTQSTNLSGWEPTQRLEHEEAILDDSQTFQFDAINLTENASHPILPRSAASLAQSASSGAIKSTPTSQSPMASKTLPRWNFIQPVKKTIIENPRRSSAGTLGVLKSFQASLPTQADFEQMKSSSLAATETNRLALDEAMSNSNTVLNLLEARLRNPNATKKHNLDPEDLTPKAIEKKKIKKAKMEELEMLKLERELAQERSGD
ncbi:hypothetical protein DFH28DRAFT_1130261 [Melampsora americana]|nr:hypothetical protein DFH28DRAFT_1130261 [Melampsora americana]